MSDPAATDISACLAALLPWTILVINDADVIASVDAPVKITWTDQPTADLPVITSSPDKSFDWNNAYTTIKLPSDPPKPLRSYIIAPDYSKAIPLEAVEFRRDEAGRVVWSEGEWPADAKPLSAAHLESLRTIKAKP